ncbi:cytosine permease [Lachnospiraceae bacterium 62-35]
MIGFQPKAEHDLYSETLAPVEYNKREVGYNGLGIVWFGAAVQISGFITITPMLQYYTIGELVWIFLIGQAILGLVCFVIQDIGLKYGISFATSITASFGPFGGKIAGLIRVLPNLVFIGTNGFMGATALNMATIALFGFDNIWFAIILNGLLVLFVTLKGVKGISIFSTLATPVLAFMGIYMFYVLFKEYHVSFSDIKDLGRLSGTTRFWLYPFGAIVGKMGAFAIGFNDVARDCTVRHGVKKSGYIHLLVSLLWNVPAFMFYSLLGCCALVIVPGMQGSEVLGHLTNLVAGNNKLFIGIFGLFIFAAQLSTNTAANLLPAILCMCGLAPKRIKPIPAGIGFTAVALLVVRAWTLGNALSDILAFFGLAAGPIITIVAIDYYYFRKRKYSLDDIYKTKGKYYYWHGINPAAMIGYGIGTAAGYMAGDYSFFASLLVTAAAYILLAKYFGKKYPAMIEETAGDVVFKKEDLEAKA